MSPLWSGEDVLAVFAGEAAPFAVIAGARLGTDCTTTPPWSLFEPEPDWPKDEKLLLLKLEKPEFEVFEPKPELELFEPNPELELFEPNPELVLARELRPNPELAGGLEPAPKPESAVEFGVLPKPEFIAEAEAFPGRFLTLKALTLESTSIPPGPM